MPDPTFRNWISRNNFYSANVTLRAKRKVKSSLCKEHRKTRGINSKLNDLKICGKTHQKQCFKKNNPPPKTLLRSHKGQTAH